MQREPLKDRARGRWPGILSAIGMPTKALRNRHGPCPMCGGKDRFRFDDKGGRGTWICNNCGAGDGIELVKQFLGLEFKEAAKEIERHIGAAPVVRSGGGLPANDDQAREDMKALWSRARPIEHEDCAGRYLHARTGLTTFPSTLRFAPDERYVEARSKPSWHPMMVAKVDPCDAAIADGERAALHRTYLDHSGRKADVAVPRKMLGSMPTGGAVRLMRHEQTLGIAEGIETALSATTLYSIPVWAALTAGLLMEWQPPEGVATVFVFGDNDVSHTGQAAAHELARRLKVKGFSVFVEIPPLAGQDWNDVLLQKGKAA